MQSHPWSTRYCRLFGEGKSLDGAETVSFHPFGYVFAHLNSKGSFLVSDDLGGSKTVMDTDGNEDWRPEKSDIVNANWKTTARRNESIASSKRTDTSIVWWTVVIRGQRKHASLSQYGKSHRLCVTRKDIVIGWTREVQDQLRDNDKERGQIMNCRYKK